MPLHHEVVCPTLVGRDPLIAAASRVLDAARDGAGRVALIVGEAGVGKSRLLRAMTEQARADGFFALHGASFEAEASIPYAPLLDLVRLFAASASPSVVAHVFAPAAGELVGIFPEVRPLLPDAIPCPTTDPESDRRRLFHALSQTVTTLARTQPVLLAFEDVHWADDATLDLVFHLARACGAQRVAIALTYRGEEVGARLARLISELQRARLVIDLPVARLGHAEVETMLHAIFGVDDGLSDDFVRLLYSLTEGNPFFVEETLKALIIAGDLAPAAQGGWHARPLERVVVPRTAVDAVRRRLAALTVPARSVASTAAVAGRRFDFHLLRTLTNLDENELLALVKELIAAQLVVEESAERFAFRHAITREAIYAELLVRERVALHRDVAAALEASSDKSADAVVEALAYHAWEAGDWERAATYASRAARHALALSAPREAVGHLDRAFAACVRGGADITIELYLTRGRANETLSDFDRADGDFTAALGLARMQSDQRAEWDALHALGMLWAARDYARAGEYRLAALDLARAIGDGSLVARSLNRVGNWHVNLEEPRAGLPHHEEALAIFEQQADEAGVAETVDLIAMAYHVAGDQRESARSYQRSVALFTRTDNRRGLANALGVLTLCGGSYHVSSTTPFATPQATEELNVLESVRLAREIGWRAGETAVRFLTADSLAWHGEYDRAIPMALDALEQAQEIAHRQWTAGSLRLLGTLALDLLAPEQARPHLETAHEIAQQLGSRLWISSTAAPLAIVRCKLGDADGAATLLENAERSTDGVADAGSLSLTLGQRQLWLARAKVAMARGETSEALAIVDARLAAERASNPTSTLGVPRLSLLRAEALMSLTRYDEARGALDQARNEAIEQRSDPMLWRVELAVGHWHRLQRRRLEARRAFDTARAIADALTTKIPDAAMRATFVERLDALIPSVPAPSANRAAKAAFGGLTKRERDVAELVAQGKANKVIAHTLGIGERTVEGYVASALGKLGFDARTQLAAWAVEKGISRPTPSR